MRRHDSLIGTEGILEIDRVVVIKSWVTQVRRLHQLGALGGLADELAAALGAAQTRCARFLAAPALMAGVVGKEAAVAVVLTGLYGNPTAPLAAPAGICGVEATATATRQGAVAHLLRRPAVRLPAVAL